MISSREANSSPPLLISTISLNRSGFIKSSGCISFLLPAEASIDASPDEVPVGVTDNQRLGAIYRIARLVPKYCAERLTSEVASRGNIVQYENRHDLCKLEFPARDYNH
jgi:hypothetical protein